MEHKTGVVAIHGSDCRWQDPDAVKAAPFIEGLRKGSYHRPDAILSLDCGPVANFPAIADDVRQLVRTFRGVNAMEGKLSYVQPEGEYIVHSLLTVGGCTQDMVSAWSKELKDNNGIPKRFHQAKQFPHLAAFIAQFPEAMNFTIKTFNGPSSIAPHEERIFHEANGRKYARIRLHLPITTLPNARVIVKDRSFKYLPGTIYYLNNSEVHYAVSLDEGQRIHLIWDCVLTDRLWNDVLRVAKPMAGVPVPKRRRYYFNTFPGKLPQWTQPWLWNNALRWAQYHAGKDTDVSVWTVEEAKEL